MSARIGCVAAAVDAYVRLRIGQVVVGITTLKLLRVSAVADIASVRPPRTDLLKREMKPSHRPSHHGFETRSGQGDDEFTCPLHLEVRHRRQSCCSICGMTLKLVVPRAESAALSKTLKRLWVALALTLPMFALEWVHLW